MCSPYFRDFFWLILEYCHTSVHCLILPMSTGACTLSCLLMYCSLANTGLADMMCSTVSSNSLQNLHLFNVIGRIRDSETCKEGGYLRLACQFYCWAKWLKLLNIFSNNVKLSLPVLPHSLRKCFTDLENWKCIEQACGNNFLGKLNIEYMQNSIRS